MDGWPRRFTLGWGRPAGQIAVSVFAAVFHVGHTVYEQLTHHLLWPRDPK
jgi:hypothetical protein